MADNPFAKYAQTAPNPFAKYVADDEDARMEKARKEVKAYREEHPTLTAVDDTVRRLARGTGLGSWSDEGNAVISSVLPEALGGRPYDEAMAIEKAKDEIGDESATKVGSLPIIGDVTTGGLTKLAGAVATAPITPVVRAMRGATILPRVVNSALTGGALGTVYGAGEGQGTERAVNAGKGLAIGTTLGAGAPALAAGVGNAVSGVRNMRQPLPPEVAQYSRPAVERTAHVMSGMDNVDPLAYQQQATRLGHEGMLADMGPNLTATTEGLAQQPGAAKRIIDQAIEARAEGAPARIRQDLNLHMGPAANIPQTIAHLEQHYGQQAAPLYEQFYRMRIPDTQPLRALYARAEASGAVDRAEQLMQIDGFDPAHLRAQNLTGREWDYIKRGIDDLASQAERRGLNEGVRRFGNLAREIRTGVDRVISPQNPAQSIWAQARGIAGDGLGARAAIAEGQRAFNKGLTADQLEADMAGRSALERNAYTIGAREQVRAATDTAATNFGPNGDAAARRMLNSPENRRKLTTIVGQRDADPIVARIEAENTMAETAHQVQGNSATARRQAVRDMIPRQYDQAKYNEIGKRTTGGLVMEGFARLANLLTAGALNERNANIASDMANMLIAQGMRRDQVARGLLNYARRQNLNQGQQQGLENFIRRFMRGSQPLAIEAATSE